MPTIFFLSSFVLHFPLPLSLLFFFSHSSTAIYMTLAYLCIKHKSACVYVWCGGGCICSYFQKSNVLSFLFLFLSFVILSYLSLSLRNFTEIVFNSMKFTYTSFLVWFPNSKVEYVNLWSKKYVACEFSTNERTKFRHWWRQRQRFLPRNPVFPHSYFPIMHLWDVNKPINMKVKYRV